MSLVSIVFFLAGRLCCRANFIFAADLTLRGQLKLTCLRHIDYKCNYFLSFLFLTGCSLSIFFGFGSKKETHTNDYRVFSKMADHLTLIARPSPFSKVAAESNFTPRGR